MRKRCKTIATLYKQHSRWGVIDKKYLCTTLTASMGMGGGFIPMVVRNGKMRKDLVIGIMNKAKYEQKVIKKCKQNSQC